MVAGCKCNSSVGIARCAACRFHEQRVACAKFVEMAMLTFTNAQAVDVQMAMFLVVAVLRAALNLSLYCIARAAQHSQHSEV